jgi:hypothetical protein
MGNPVTDFLGGLVKDGKGNVDPTKVAAGLAALTGLYGATNRDSSIGEFMFGRPQQPVGYTGGIPEYKIERNVLPDAFATTTPTGEPRRPGSGGRRYFTDTTYTPTGKTMAGATPSQGVYDALTATQANELFNGLFGTGGLGGENTEGLGGAAAVTPAAVTPAAVTPAAAAKAKVDADAAKYNALIQPYLGGKTLTDKDFLTLRSSGYDVGKLATDLGIKPVGTATGADRLTGATQRAEAQAAATVADQIRQGNYTPATAATKLNELYPGYNMSEESVVFELLNRGQTTPQEVAKYYADRGYAPEEVLARYQQLGGTRTFAQGGLASLPQSRGYYLGGATDGMADEIPATIEDTEPAALSDGEFVIPADVVSHLGNGNSDAGARQLYAMMDRIRQARTGRKEQGRKINPNKYIPV